MKDDAKDKGEKDNMKSPEDDGSFQEEITIAAIMIPTLAQTHSCPKGETLDRQWVGRRI